MTGFIKCGCCSKFMSPADGAKCAKCGIFFHRFCVALPQSGIISPTWRCSGCKKKLPKDKNAEKSTSPIYQDTASTSTSPESSGDIMSELRQIRDELRTVRDEFQAFREEVAELRALNSRLDNIEKRLDVLENSKKDPFVPDSKVAEIVAQLKCDLNERDQELLSNDLEISNIPEFQGESLVHTVKVLATKLGVNLEDRDMVSVDRVGSRHIDATNSPGPTEARPKIIVVRFARRDLRDAIVKGARVRRGATTADLDLPGPPRRFYVNERLTKSNRMLFRQARDAGQRNDWKFVWTYRGRILARRRSGDAVCRIRCEADIQRIFGSSSKD